jgi:hypothetical protein
MIAWKNFVFVRLSAVSSPSMKMRLMRWEIRTVRPGFYLTPERTAYLSEKR